MVIKKLDYMPIVTIVTPSLNQGVFIKETIDSVLTQDYPYIEYIIIDGGSTDETLDILKQYGERIRWISEKDNGQTEAINKGWKMSKGEIIAWLNSDDTYQPGAVSKAVNHLCNYKEHIMVYGEGRHIDESGNVIDRYPTEPFNYNRLAETCFICQPTVFIRKEALKKVGFLNEGLNYCMDYDYWIRLGKRYSVGYINDLLANSRLYAETKTLAQRAKVHKEVIQTLCRHFGFVNSNWVYSYCDALLGNQSNVNRSKSSIKYIILLSFLFLINSLKYNKKISFNDIKLYFKWMKKIARIKIDSNRSLFG